MGDSLYLFGAKEGAEKIRSGAVSARRWAESCIGRIKESDSAIHAWAYFNEQKFLNQAELIDQKVQASLHAKSSEISLGSLCGVPVGVKDIFNTSDMPTCMGSPIWEGFTPGNDARTVFYIKQADGIVAGKTVTAEFAVHAPGKTTNPHHPEHSPGTSSSGSAAAVASFMLPVALGTQTAGSIIRPASYCGVYGFKPTFGLIPRTGTLKTTDSLDTIGMFARNVEDLELLFETIRVHGEDHPLSHAFLGDKKKQMKKGSRWKVGVVTSSLWVWDNATSYAKQAFQEFCENLSKAGIEINELNLPRDFNEAHDIHSTIYDKTLSYYFKEEFKKHTLVSDIIYRIISHGQQISSDQYKQALEKQNRLSRLFDDILEDYDVILTLSTAGQAPKWGGDDIPDSCLIWTLCGLPVINLPVFRSSDALPFGAQIITKRYCDKLLLNFASDLEELFPGRMRVLPPEREILAS